MPDIAVHKYSTQQQEGDQQRRLLSNELLSEVAGFCKMRLKCSPIKTFQAYRVKFFELGALGFYMASKCKALHKERVMDKRVEDVEFDVEELKIYVEGLEIDVERLKIDVVGLKKAIARINLLSKKSAEGTSSTISNLYFANDELTTALKEANAKIASLEDELKKKGMGNRTEESHQYDEVASEESKHQSELAAKVEKGSDEKGMGNRTEESNYYWEIEKKSGEKGMENSTDEPYYDEVPSEESKHLSELAAKVEKGSDEKGKDDDTK